MVLIASSVILGGAPNSANWQILVLCILSAILLPAAFAAGAGGRFAKLPHLLRWVVVGIVLLPLFQLIPLPPSIWAALPGRELAADVFSLLGTKNAWHGLSLVPRDTLFAFLVLLPAAAAFLSALSLDRSGRRRIIWVLLAAATVSIVVGVIQFGTKGAAWDIYSTFHRGSFLGFFANRNHQGLFMAISGSFAIAAIQQRLRNPRLAMATSALVAMVFFIAAVGTVSRAGIGLTFLSLLTTFYAYFIYGRVRWPIIAAGIVIGLLGLYFVTFSSTVQTALDRFSQIGENGRLEIWQKSWPLIEQFNWAGAGIGSFTTVYPPIERLSDVFPFFYNRVHNEYLELLIEAGLPGLLLLGLFVWLLARRSIAAWRGTEELDAFAFPAGMSILLVGLHSIVDYPLRTQSHAVIFALACAFFFAPSRNASRDSSSEMQAFDWSSRSVRLKALGIAGQAAALIAFALFATYQQSSVGGLGRAEASLVNADGPTLNPTELARAKRALARQPLDQGLLNTIYASEVREGLDERQRRAYVATLLNMGWRDTVTQQNLLFEAARRNDLSAALDHMDALLRRGKLIEQIIPLLAQLEIDPAGTKLVAERLAQEPGWRTRYFYYAEPLANPEILDARLRLFEYMAQQEMPVERLELRATLNALLSAGRRDEIVELARTQSSPEQASNQLYDADFDQLKPVPIEERRQYLPYEWRLTNRSGVSTQIITDDWSSRLVLRWNGRGAPIIARTLTFLAENSQPDLEVALAGGGSPRGLDALRFSLICPGEPEVLFVRKAAGSNPGLDRDSNFYAAERAVPCDYPDLLVGGRPQVGDRGADLSIDTIRLSLP